MALGQLALEPARTHDAPAQPRPTLSVVVPVHNETPVLRTFHQRLRSVLDSVGDSFEIVYVNDGSTDDSLAQLRELRSHDPSCAVVNLSRNFGKEIAMTAGLDHARCTGAVVVIDADLQDPPELIPHLIAEWRRGYDMVYAQRRRREGETWLKKTTAFLFYRLMDGIGGVAMPRDVGDFRLLSRRALDAVLALRERHRFMKGLFAWVGFRSIGVPYDRAPRYAGQSSWNYWKLWNFALEGITSFTVMPLKVASYFGVAVALFAAIYLGQLLVRTLIFGNPVAGYASLMAVVLFMGGVQLITLGVLGEYLGRVFNEIKNRPLYLVEAFDPAGEPGRDADFDHRLRNVVA